MTTQQDAKHIEELMLEAETASEPGDMEPTVDLEGGLRGTISLEGTGWVHVWDTRTGEISRVPSHPDYLRTQLDKRRADGSRVFTTVRPAIEPFRGTEKCPLHPDSPEAQRYTSLGLPTCRKSNLRNRAEAERHMRIKHKDTFDTLERMREREIEQEERELRRLNIESLSRMAGNSEPPAAAEAEVEWNNKIYTAESPEQVSEKCECGDVYWAKNQGGLNLKRLHHRKKCPVYKK